MTGLDEKEMDKIGMMILGILGTIAGIIIVLSISWIVVNYWS